MRLTSIADCENSSLTVGAVAQARLARRIERTLADAGIVCRVAWPSGEDLLAACPAGALSAVIVQLGDEEAPVARRRIASVHAAFPDVPLVGVQLGHCGEDRQLLRVGLAGSLSGEQLESCLPTVVRAVAAGLVCLPQRLRHELHRDNLSGRERQILGLVVSGQTNAQIAARLFLAESTVKSHLSSAYQKLGVRSRREAMTLILDPDSGLSRGILAISAA